MLSSTGRRVPGAGRLSNHRGVCWCSKFKDWKQVENGRCTNSESNDVLVHLKTHRELYTKPILCILTYDNVSTCPRSQNASTLCWIDMRESSCKSVPQKLLSSDTLCYDIHRFSLKTLMTTPPRGKKTPKSLQLWSKNKEIELVVPFKSHSRDNFGEIIHCLRVLERHPAYPKLRHIYHLPTWSLKGVPFSWMIQYMVYQYSRTRRWRKFQKGKIYNAEEHVAIESFVTTLIHWTFFSDDANKVGICWLCRSGQLHVTPSSRWSLPRCHRSVRNDMRLFLRTKQYPVQLRTTKYYSRRYYSSTTKY